MIGYVRENIQMPYDRELYLLLLLHIIEIAMHGNFSILIFSNKSDSSIVKQSLQFQSERQSLVLICSPRITFENSTCAHNIWICYVYIYHIPAFVMGRTSRRSFQYIDYVLRVKKSFVFQIQFSILSLLYVFHLNLQLLSYNINMQSKCLSTFQ